MRILISGVTGYLGGRIAKELAKNNHHVIGLVRNSTKVIVSDLLESNVDLFDFDAADAKELDFPHKSIDLIIHTATSYGKNGESEEEIFNVNVTFPHRLMNLGVLLKVKTFINTDTALDWSVNAYAASKKKFLDSGKEFAKENNIQFINLKLENFFGPMMSESNFIEMLVRSCIKNNERIDLTPGDQIRDFIYIDDVINAYIQIVKNLEKINTRYKQFEIGSGFGISVKSLAIMIKKISTSSTKLNFGAIPYRDNEIMFSIANTNNLQELGWKCQVHLEAGITEIIKKYQLN